MEYTFQRLTPEHAGDLQRLYKRVFGKKISIEQIREKYDTSYLGKSWYGYFAFHNHEPVAFFGVIPVMLTYNGKRELSAQVVDSMTDPAHGKKGLYTQLAFIMYEILQAEGFSCVWAFANQNSEAVMTHKLGFQFENRIKGYVLNSPQLFLYKLLRKLTPSLAHKLFLKRFVPFQCLDSFSGLMTRAKDRVTIDRLEAYMRYKSFSGNLIIRIENVLFWVKPANGLLIGDVEADSPEKLKSAITVLWEFQRRHKMGPLVFQSLPGTMLTDVLEDLADHTFESWGVCYKNFSSGFPLERLFVTLGDIDTF